MIPHSGFWECVCIKPYYRYLFYAGRFCLFLIRYFIFFGGSDETVKYAREFMQVILLGNVVTHLYLGLNAVLRASGHPQKHGGNHHDRVNQCITCTFVYFVFDWESVGGYGYGLCTVDRIGLAASFVLSQR